MWVLGLVLGGCTERFDLGEVPVEGGTAEQHAIVGTEVEAFTRWTGAGRIQLSRVTFTDLEGIFGIGSYDIDDESIEISTKLVGDALRRTLRHELCHALDYQEGLLDDSNPTFDRVVDEILDMPSHSLHGVLGREEGRRKQRGAVLAEVCENGPLGTAILSQPCGQQAIDLVDVARFLADEVWLGEPDVAMTPAVGWSGATTSWRAPVVAEELTLIGARDLPHVLHALIPSDTGETRSATVSVLDGAEAPTLFWPEDMTLAEVEAGYRVERPEGAPFEPTYDLLVAGEVYAVSRGEITLRLLDGYRAGALGGPQASHVLVHDGAQWAVVDGACPAEPSSVFLAYGVLYLGWSEGEVVHWGPITPQLD